MLKVRCIIVDDEPLAREGMENLCSTFDSIEVLGSFPNAFNSNEFLMANSVDLMFLDIEMPGLNGTNFLSELTDPPLTIFTTAYSEYALEGFNLNAVDYLLKPISKQRFFKAVNRALDIFKSKNAVVQDEETITYTYIAADRKYTKVFYNDIIYIEGMKDYVIIHTKDEKITPAMNLKTILTKLPERQFVRVNKSYIINADYISSVETDLIYLGEKEIPMGRTYKEDFIQRFIKSNVIKRK